MDVQYKFKIGDAMEHTSYGDCKFTVEDLAVLANGTPGYSCSWKDSSKEIKIGTFAEVNLREPKNRHYGTREVSGKY